MSKLGRIVLPAIISLAVLAPPSGRAEDVAGARARYNEATQALKDKRYREAALHFEAAARLRPHGVAAFAAAMAWDKAEQPARAADNFARALELPGLGPADTKTARARLDELESSLGTVSITGPAELLVQLQDSTEANPPARLHGNAGVQTLIVVRDGKVERKDLVLHAGETLEIDVTEPIEEPPPPAASASASAEPAPPQPPPPPPPPPADKGPSTRKIIGYSAMGAGVLSAGVAIALGVQTLSARDDYEAAPTRQGYDDAKSLRTWTNVAWAGTVVLGGVGAALVFWPESKSEQGKGGANVTVSASPTGVLLRGAF